MLHRGTLDAIFERSTEKWTKSSTLVDAFTSRAITSSWFVRPVAKWISAQIEKKITKVNIVEKESDLFRHSPPTSPSLPKLSVEVKICKRATEKHKKTKKRPEPSKRIHRNWKSSSSSSSLMNLLSSPAVLEADSVTKKAKKYEKTNGR